MEKQLTRVLNFQLKNCAPKFWFRKDKHFNSEVKNKFGDLLEDALFGCVDNWHKNLDSYLAFNHPD